MLTLFYLSLILCFAYAVLIFYIYQNWQNQTDWQLPKAYKSETMVSVIVAVRNESIHIRATVESILNNDYPKGKLELLVIDDHSDDDTPAILKQINHNSLRLHALPDGQFGKKAAIAHGISLAKAEIILITDGDCLVPKDWVINQVSHLEENELDFSAGPVILPSDKGHLQQLQDADIAGMMAVTQAGIRSKQWYMANGANMCFRKSVFLDIDGFKENLAFASGDDMFLINRLAEIDKSKIGFLKTSNAVRSMPVSSLHGFYEQRLRWATKNRAYANSGVTYVLALVFIFCLLTVFNLAASSVFGRFIFFVALFMLAWKMLVDYLLLFNVSKYFGLKNALRNYLSVSILYLVYIVFIGVASIFVKSYNWKGRQTR